MVVTRLQGEGAAIQSLESAGDAAGEAVVADHGLVPLLRLVGEGVGRDEVGEAQCDIVDFNIVSGGEDLGADTDLNTGENVALVTAREGSPGAGVNNCEELLGFFILL